MYYKLNIKVMRKPNKKPNKSSRLIFRVEDSIHLKLLKLSNKRGIKISQLIRELLVEGLEK